MSVNTDLSFHVPNKGAFTCRKTPLTSKYPWSRKEERTEE